MSNLRNMCGDISFLSPSKYILSTTHHTEPITYHPETVEGRSQPRQISASYNEVGSIWQNIVNRLNTKENLR